MAMYHIYTESLSVVFTTYIFHLRCTKYMYLPTGTVTAITKFQ